jgi:HSP20 family molecular chaperone IbpA
MARFVDEIDRLFEELVHDPWRQPVRPVRTFRPSPLGATWEFAVPIRGAGRDDVAISAEGPRLTVTIRHRTTGSGARDAEEQFQQSFTLPEDAELATLEARFEDHVLRIRVTLRRQPALRQR